MKQVPSNIPRPNSQPLGSSVSSSPHLEGGFQYFKTVERSDLGSADKLQKKRKKKKSVK